MRVLIFTLIFFLGRAYTDSTIRFLLYTRSNPTEAQELMINDTVSLYNSHLNRLHPTRIVIYGYRNKLQDEIVTLIRDAYLKKGYFNVIVVDWFEMANSLYPMAVGAVPIVGHQTAKLISVLQNLKLIELYQLTIVGFSLGAHCAGYAGRALHPQKVDSIVALDPPYILFDLKTAVSRNDANYVQVLHTDTTFLGFKEDLGHVDFYPNFGKMQPGCWWMDVFCTHFRAFHYFAETIADPSAFMGQQCVDYKEIDQETCTNSGVVLCRRMGGEPLDKLAKGVFFVEVDGGKNGSHWKC